MTDFEGLIQLLAKAQVEFILVGGAAATAHGSSRLTTDLDIVYGRSRQNLERLVSCLSPHRPYLRGAPEGLPFRLDVQTLERGLNFTLITDCARSTYWERSPGAGGMKTFFPTPSYSISSACLVGA